MNYTPLKIELVEWAGKNPALAAMRLPKDGVRRTDKELCQHLVKLGGSHAKFSRLVVYYLKTSFQAGFLVELDTYRHGREVGSTTSSMHNELKELEGIELAEQKQADLSTKVYTQIAMYSAQVLRKIYLERRKHRHPDWQIFCDLIETLPMVDWFILPEKALEEKKELTHPHATTT